MTENSHGSENATAAAAPQTGAQRHRSSAPPPVQKSTRSPTDSLTSLKAPASHTTPEALLPPNLEVTAVARKRRRSSSTEARRRRRTESSESPVQRISNAVAALWSTPMSTASEGARSLGRASPDSVTGAAADAGALEMARRAVAVAEARLARAKQVLADLIARADATEVHQSHGNDDHSGHEDSKSGHEASKSRHVETAHDDAPPEESGEREPADCCACLLPLVDDACTEEERDASQVLEMPCCGAAIHLACAAACVGNRCIRDDCPACQKPFAATTVQMIETRNKEQRQRSKVQRVRIEANLRGMTLTKFAEAVAAPAATPPESATPTAPPTVAAAAETAPKETTEQSRDTHNSQERAATEAYERPVWARTRAGRPKRFARLAVAPLPEVLHGIHWAAHEDTHKELISFIRETGLQPGDMVGDYRVTNRDFRSAAGVKQLRDRWWMTPA